MDEAKNQINNLAYKDAKNKQSDQQNEKSSKKKNEDNVRNLQDNFKRTNIHMRGGARRERARNWKSVKK